MHPQEKKNFSKKKWYKRKKSWKFLYNWRKQYCGVWKITEENINCYFIENDYYFNRENFYGYYDDGERFIFFSKAITELFRDMENPPQVVHTHDWQTAAVNVYLQEKVKTVFTIHNLRYQGRFGREAFDELMDLPETYFTDKGLEYYGDLNLMKGGIIFANHITTVSPNYSKEIMGEFFGEGLDGVLRANEQKVSGILNGLDYEEYNPCNDKALFYNYRSSMDRKLRNKEKLQEICELEVNKKKPLLTLVSRFTEQKVLDLLIYIMDELLRKDIQLIVHGNGEKYYEDTLRSFEKKYPDNYRLIQGFKEDMARKIYSGGDIFLMPSLFEPCGISQMIALNYGNIPVVREVGGLKDTIIPFNEFTSEGNGFSFANYNGEEFLKVIEYALEIYKDKDKWNELFKNALKSKFTWEKSAKEYMEIYKNLK